MSSEDKQIEHLERQCAALIKVIAQLKAGDITLDDVEIKAGEIENSNNS